MELPGPSVDPGPQVSEKNTLLKPLVLRGTPELRVMATVVLIQWWT